MAITGQIVCASFLAPRLNHCCFIQLPRAARLTASTKVDLQSSARRCLFVIFDYASTECSSNANKDTYYHEMSVLLCRSISLYVAMAAAVFWC